MQKFLPTPDLTILLDIAPEVAAERKKTDRDRYERDLDLLTRVRASYRTQATDERWILIPGDRARDEVSADVQAAVRSRLGLL